MSGIQHSHTHDDEDDDGDDDDQYSVHVPWNDDSVTFMFSLQFPSDGHSVCPRHLFCHCLPNRCATCGRTEHMAVHGALS